MRYTVISFNFKNYDLVREPRNPDPEADYVFVTDKVPEGDSRWRFVVDKDLPTHDPIYASYFVRYHPFRYAKTDIVVVVDASVKINDSLAPIVDEFVEYGADYMPMLTSYGSDDVKMDAFKRMGRVDDKELSDLNYFLEEQGQTGWKGSIGCAFAIFRNTEPAVKLLYYTWQKLLELAVPRMDEVVLHKMLYNATGIKVLLTSIQILQSTYMTYCKHGKTEPAAHYIDYDEQYFVCNMPVSPRRFSKSIDYPRAYRYRTEAMLLTKHLDEPDMVAWLDWHLNRCGFDRVHVFDNESGFDVRRVCDRYGDRVTYEKVEGHPRQYRLYDRYVNFQSQAEWIMPIDDDEFLDLGEFENVGAMLDYYRKKLPHLGMLAIRWRHLFPTDFNQKRTSTVLEYCTEENPELARKFMKLGDGTIKCIVRRCGQIHYQETWENPAGGHVPTHSCHAYALTCDGHHVRGCGITNVQIEDERVRLLHCRYQGPEHWKLAHGADNMTVSDWVARPRNFQKVIV